MLYKNFLCKVPQVIKKTLYLPVLHFVSVMLVNCTKVLKRNYFRFLKKNPVRQILVIHI